MDPHVLSLLLLSPHTCHLRPQVSDILRPRLTSGSQSQTYPQKNTRHPDSQTHPVRGILHLRRVNLLSGLSQKDEALIFHFQPPTSSLKATGWVG